MARRRFIAPSRGGADPRCFEHPVFDGVSAFRPWFAGPDWPALDRLDAAMPVAGKRFALQDPALLGDGLHYEARVSRGAIATRAENWHDLFNAAIWCRIHPSSSRSTRSSWRTSPPWARRGATARSTR